MFKVNNKETRTMNFTHSSGVSIGGFELAIAGSGDEL